MKKVDPEHNHFSKIKMRTEKYWNSFTVTAQKFDEELNWL